MGSPNLYLPIDILHAIINAIPHSQGSTLAALLRVSRTTYDIASPLLYADLTLTDHNLPGVLLGLIRPDTPSDATYPSKASDERKRKLLSYTRTLRVRSFPPDPSRHHQGKDDAFKVNSDLDSGTYTPTAMSYLSCPLDKNTFPAVTTLEVSTHVPYHDGVPRRE